MKFLRFLSQHSEFIYIGIRFRLIKYTLRLFGIRHFNFTIILFGYTYRGDIINHLDFHVYFFGRAERGILNLIESVIDKDSVALDVGANTGHHTLYLSKHCREVMAFEPYASVRTVLTSRLEENGIKNVKVYQCGLSDEEALKDYYEPEESNMGTGSFLPEYYDQNRPTGMKLQLKKGDDVIRETNPDRLDFIKIDVEGFELQVLKGLKETIAKYTPYMVIELSSFNVGNRDLLNLFAPQDYDLYYFANEFIRTVNLKDIKYATKPGHIFARPKRATRKLAN